MRPRFVHLLILLSVLVASGAPCLGGEPKLRTDRWVEADLYWFDREHIPQSVAEFLERMHPLYQNATGWRGAIVNVGWMVDYIAGFQGSLDQRIPLPEFEVKHWLPPQYKQLPFPLPMERVVYQPWTYRDLEKLGEEFRRQAAVRYGMPDFKFGTFVLGEHEIYGPSVKGWRSDHAEAWTPKGSKESGAALIPGAALRADTKHYAGFPNGIPEGTPFYRFFALQWGALSRAAHLDALVLRDGMWGQFEYVKVGPFGTHASSNPADMERWREWAASLVRETKLANPACLLLGYSTGVSAVSEWRLDGFDLERIATEGHLDAWIDQSWGEAWNEYWRIDLAGYTFQLANILFHAAQLARTPTRHYVLIDTWDAWEPWDVIHTVPNKIQWEIWAYTHAAVKMPGGEKVPRGMYLSWANHGQKLWTRDDVAFLARNADQATADALATRQTHGPTLVYNRSFVAWLQSQHPAWMVKEFTEDYAGMLMKWQVPILSVTRMDWVPSVRSDMFVFQSPARLESPAVEALRALSRSGQPFAIVSDPTYGVDPGVKEILAALCKTVSQERVERTAKLVNKVPGVSDGSATEFKLWQGEYELAAKPQATVIYQTGSCPDLMFADSSQARWIYWDPPFFSPNEFTLRKAKLTDVVEDFEPYVLAARLVLKLIGETGRSPLGSAQPVQEPLAVHYWTRNDGAVGVLVGNLERSPPHDSEQPKTLDLALPAALFPLRVKRVTGRELNGNRTVEVKLDASGRWRCTISVAANGSSAWMFTPE